MKVSEQCSIAASKGNQILGLIRRNITYKEKRLIIPLYKTVDQIEVFKILNGYENIGRNIFFLTRKIVEVEDMR